MDQIATTVPVATKPRPAGDPPKNDDMMKAPILTPIFVQDSFIQDSTLEILVDGRFAATRRIKLCPTQPHRDLGGLCYCLSNNRPNRYSCEECLSCAKCKSLLIPLATSILLLLYDW
jgi:hypothetical protein